MPNPSQLPTFYIPHGGGPCFLMDWPASMGGPDTWKKMAEWLGELARCVSTKPTAIVVISGHWEEPEFTVSSAANPVLFFDYYGFPEHTYRLEYPAPGSPELAGEICRLLEGSGIPARQHPERGFDHGVFIPFKLIYPNSDIPIVQLSLREGLDPAAHIAAGRAIAPLRERAVLIVGSGMSYHNLREFGADARAISDRFDAWLTDAVCAPSAAERADRLSHWREAPGARRAHPREEHLIPLMVAAGAAAEDLGAKIFTDHVLGTTISAFRFGE